MSTGATPRDSPARRRLLPAWVGVGVYAGYTLVRAASGFGTGVASSLSLPDAPNRPGLVTGVAGSAGSLGAGAAPLCPWRRERPDRAVFEPDLEDELLWRRLRRAVPALHGWEDWPRDRPLDEAEPGPSPPSIHGFGDEPPAPDEPATDRETAAGAREPEPSLGALLRQRPCASVALLGLVVSLAMLAVEFLYLRRIANPTGTDILRNAGRGAWTVGWMMLATVAVRTFRLRDVVRFWLIGFFAAAGIVAIVGAGVTTVLPPGLLRTGIVIPILEEVVKAALLLAFLLVVVRGRGREPAISDLVIVGFALGAAFGVHEDALWPRLGGHGFGPGWGSLFPTFAWDPFVVVAHAGWTALVGLGLGLGWHYRRHRLAWLIPVVLLAVAIYDHISINYAVFEAAELGVGRGTGFAMRQLTGHGSLIAQLLLVGFVAAVVIDWLALRRRTSSDPLPAWSTWPGVQGRVRALPGPLAKVVGAALLAGERRAHVGARYAMARGEQASPPAGAAA